MNPFWCAMFLSMVRLHVKFNRSNETIIYLVHWHEWSSMSDVIVIKMSYEILVNTPASLQWLPAVSYFIFHYLRGKFEISIIGCAILQSELTFPALTSISWCLMNEIFTIERSSSYETVESCALDDYKREWAHSLKILGYYNMVRLSQPVLSTTTMEK